MRVLLWTALLAVLTTPAYAQEMCGPHDAIMQSLGEKGGALVVVATADDGSLFEVVATGGGAFWAIVVTNPHNNSCIAATGKDWSPRKWLMPPVSPEYGTGI
jgi:hypothetical protein